jgi:hypothetical protein
MGKQQELPSNLQERFLLYLQTERAELLREIKQGDAKAVEDRKRLRQIDREIETIRGGAL